MTTISLTVLDDDAAEVDRLSRELHTELLALDLDQVDLVLNHEIPPLTKSAPANVDAILIALASSPVLVQLGALLRDWVNRANGRKIILRDGDRVLELTGGSTKHNSEVIKAFFHRQIE